jgi:hypothetical protein
MVPGRINLMSIQAIAASLLEHIDRYMKNLQALPPGHFEYRSAPGKWSRKEMIGHLVDSAQSNIRRFVVSQYETDPLITYQQDQWVSIANYQEWDITRLISLWYLLNLQAVEILKHFSEEESNRTCLTPERHTIEWLASDYIVHLRHHMEVVLLQEKAGL